MCTQWDIIIMYHSYTCYSSMRTNCHHNTRWLSWLQHNDRGTCCCHYNIMTYWFSDRVKICIGWLKKQLACFWVHGFLSKMSPQQFYIYRVFTGLGEHSCICETSSVKPTVAPEEAACNLINRFKLFQLMAKLRCGWCRPPDLGKE